MSVEGGFIMKILITAAAIFAIVLLGQNVAAAGNCAYQNWAPSSLSLNFWESGGYKYSEQHFKWTTTKASTFNAANVYYQYEVRRDKTKNKWNFFNNYPWEGVFWSNLPGAQQWWSEESGTLFGPDEEMQLKTGGLLPPKITANMDYYVRSRYTRLLPSTTINVQTESEYCGPAFCTAGQIFDYCIMNNLNVAS
jgi:hypothetical protein